MQHGHCGCSACRLLVWFPSLGRANLFRWVLLVVLIVVVGLWVANNAIHEEKLKRKQREQKASIVMSRCWLTTSPKLTNDSNCEGLKPKPARMLDGQWTCYTNDFSSLLIRKDHRNLHVSGFECSTIASISSQPLPRHPSLARLNPQAS